MHPIHVLDLKYNSAGLLIGFLIGMTGMGGGSLMTPLLVLIGVPPTMAVGTDPLLQSITKIVGGWQHHRQKTVDYGLAWRLAIGSIPGSLLGVAFMHGMQKHMPKDVELIIKHWLGCVLIFVAIALIIQTIPKVRDWIEKLPQRSDKNLAVVAAVSGLVLGFLVGMTSVGSGTLFGVLMLVVFRLSPRRMVGTDVFQAAILTTSTAIGQIFAHNVNFALSGALMIGSIPGVLIGSRLAGKMPNGVIRPVLAVILLLSGIKML